MEGTIVLTSIFSLAFMLFGYRVYQSYKEVNSLSEFILLIVCASLIFIPLFIGSMYIVKKQYKFDKSLINGEEKTKKDISTFKLSVSSMEPN